MSITDAVVYGYLNGFAIELGDIRAVWESTRSIASKLGISADIVSVSMRNLERVGLLEVRRSKGKSNVCNVLHDLRDSDDDFGLEQSEELEEDDEYSNLPAHVKAICRSWSTTKKEQESSAFTADVPQCDEDVAETDTVREENVNNSEPKVHTAIVKMIQKYVIRHENDFTKITHCAILKAFNYADEEIERALDYMCDKEYIGMVEWGGEICYYPREES